jgi:deoxyribodipyrimidine photolyase-related protein
MILLYLHIYIKMRSIFIILPNQLFYEDYEKLEYKNNAIIEHPLFFHNYNYNTLKLLMHRYTMQKFYEHFENKKMKYIDCNTSYNHIFEDYDQIILYDPVDHYIYSEFETVSKKYNCEIIYLDSPGWISGSLDYDGEKRNQTIFYKWQRERLGLFIDKLKPLVYDNQNRQPFKPTDIASVSNANKNIYYDYTNDKLYQKSVDYVKKNFPNNPGSYNYYLPSDMLQSKKFFTTFIKKKLKNFGPYQDGLSPDTDFGYHSVMSPIINIGLITPTFIINKIKKIYKNYPFQSIEGYIRQIIGWREYCRYVYINDGPVYGNRFKANKKMDDDLWYNLFNNVDNVYDSRVSYDDIIKLPKTYLPDIIYNLLIKVWSNGYLHHIERLMVLGNYMNYSKIRPDYCYQWFMSAFLDSYHVFMDTNLYGMAMNCIRPDKLISSKPAYKLPVSAANYDITNGKKYYMSNRMYICSSNYIIKMGWKLNKKDIELFDKLYYNFIAENHEYLSKNYATARNVAHWKKKYKKN